MPNKIDGIEEGQRRDDKKRVEGEQGEQTWKSPPQQEALKKGGEEKKSVQSYFK